MLVEYEIVATFLRNSGDWVFRTHAHVQPYCVCKIHGVVELPDSLTRARELGGKNLHEFVEPYVDGALWVALSHVWKQLLFVVCYVVTETGVAVSVERNCALILHDKSGLLEYEFFGTCERNDFSAMIAR